MQVFLEGGLAVQSQEFESSGSSNGGPPLNLPAIDFSLNVGLATVLVYEALKFDLSARAYTKFKDGQRYLKVYRTTFSSTCTAIFKPTHPS